MRRDPVFEEEHPFCYQPQGSALLAFRPHSALYCSFHAESREEDLLTLAGEEPELALVAECVNSMELFPDCAEIRIWRHLLDQIQEDEVLSHHREIMPELVSCIRERCEDDVFHELYFSMVLPIVSAVDADEPAIALRLYLNMVTALEARYLPIPESGCLE